SSACTWGCDHQFLCSDPDAYEWATYLQQILKSSRKFRKRPIVLHAVAPADELHGYDFEYFQRCRCILLLLTGELMDMLWVPELQVALRELLYPPQRVVALLCGVLEDDVRKDCFEDWPSWRKLSAEDDPYVYISTISESIAESTQNLSKLVAGLLVNKTFLELHNKTVAPAQLTVQPNRVLCGERETLFIIFRHKLDVQSTPEVEFSSESVNAQRVPGTVENEYTISVAAPDLPAGVVSLTLHTDQSSVSLRPVTYYTNMGEVSRCLENAADPVNFICQAFKLQSNATESLDNMLTESLKSRMPTTGFQVFGVRQIEEENMSAYQRSEEFPTLLHFAAEYGLKKLMATLLQCPGALQACSVMNKNGDYPNSLAEKSGFSDLRQFVDKFVEEAAMLKFGIEDALDAQGSANIYELMSATSQDITIKNSDSSEDIYESMLMIDPECAEDLSKPQAAVNQENQENLESDPADTDDRDKTVQIEEEEDLYHLSPDDIYDTVDPNSTYNAVLLNRPPATISRPASEPEQAVIFRGTIRQTKCSLSQPVARPLSPAYDPYAGMKTPGQRQLISLQERVKVGQITVDEAVQEFKAWQFDHERRANSIRYQNANIKRLRDSITRRHRERQKTGKELDYEISAPLQKSLYSSSSFSLECGVYEATPRGMAGSAAQVIQRGTWKASSTSSTSSSDSNRHSTHSNFSYSSGTEPDFEVNDFNNICVFTSFG
uniref:DBB domain-containing protein n=1 Tax=Mola mola TaxID=94237 RepID=A0A3Q3W3V6_MOLML